MTSVTVHGHVIRSLEFVMDRASRRGFGLGAVVGEVDRAAGLAADGEQLDPS